MVRSIRSPDRTPPAPAPAVPLCAQAGNSRANASDAAAAVPADSRRRRSSESPFIMLNTHAPRLALEHRGEFLPGTVNPGLDRLAADPEHARRFVLAEPFERAQDQRF